MRVRTAIILSLLCIAPHVARAQRLPAAGGTTRSLGQPRPWTWTVGFGLGLVDLPDETAGVGEARVSGYREMISRSIGGGGLDLEAYNQVENARYNAGARLRLKSQLTGIAVGIDYNATQSLVRAILTYVYPGRRSGVFGDGSTLRLDFVSGPNRTLSIGLEKSIFDRIPKGIKRPTTDRAKLEGKPPSKAEIHRTAQNLDTAFNGSPLRHALDSARVTARNIQQLGVPWLDHTGGLKGSDDRVVERLRSLNHLASSSGANLSIDRTKWNIDLQADRPS